VLDMTLSLGLLNHHVKASKTSLLKQITY